MNLSAFVALMSMAVSTTAFTTPKLTATPTSLSAIPPGYVGGFADSEPQYAYPQLSPDLSDLPVMGNMENIDKLDRQQKVLWPQFSWLSIPGDEQSRVYQMFAPDISRLGYTNEGRVYSIICPQQGFGTALLGELNVEVTVTGVRGWCKETEKTIYADMGVMGQVWFTNGDSKVLSALEKVMDMKDFPMSKANSIKVLTNNPNEPYNNLFQLKNGTSPAFPHPEYAQHWDEAYGVGHLSVEIGEVVKTGDAKVDEFNEMIIKIFNIGSGNIFTQGSSLSWNVWFKEPELVNRDEWQAHAEIWRESLDVEHRSPTDDGYYNQHDEQTYFDGTVFKPLKTAAQQEAKLISGFLEKWAEKKLADEVEDILHVVKRIDFFHR